MSEQYLWIRNWDRFQHYKNRRPPWIKFYLELLDDDNYLDLTEHRALPLHRLWLAFASSRCRLRLDTATISSRCRLRVTMADIEALAQAGFLDIIASTTLAARKQNAIPDKEVDREEELEIEPGGVTSYATKNGTRETNPAGISLEQITPQLRSIA